VRPLPRRRKARAIAATPPDQVVAWTEDDRLVRAEVGACQAAWDTNLGEFREPSGAGPLSG
jgi:hypothetical protein